MKFKIEKKNNATDTLNAMYIHDYYVVEFESTASQQLSRREHKCTSRVHSDVLCVCISSLLAMGMAQGVRSL